MPLDSKTFKSNLISFGKQLMGCQPNAFGDDWPTIIYLTLCSLLWISFPFYTSSWITCPLQQNAPRYEVKQ